MAKLAEVKGHAIRLFAKGEALHALRLYDAIVAAAPLDFVARIKVADCLVALGKPELAIEVYRAVGWYALKAGHPLVAVVEVGHILYVSANLFRRGFNGLLDAAPPASQTALIAGVARGVPGVMGVADVKSRNVGATVLVESAWYGRYRLLLVGCRRRPPSSMHLLLCCR